MGDSCHAFRCHTFNMCDSRLTLSLCVTFKSHTQYEWLMSRIQFSHIQYVWLMTHTFTMCGLQVTYSIWVTHVTHPKCVTPVALMTVRDACHMCHSWLCDWCVTHIECVWHESHILRVCDISHAYYCGTQICVTCHTFNTCDSEQVLMSNIFNKCDSSVTHSLCMTHESHLCYACLQSHIRESLLQIVWLMSYTQHVWLGWVLIHISQLTRIGNEVRGWGLMSYTQHILVTRVECMT